MTSSANISGHTMQWLEPQQELPFSPVYGCKVVLTLEIHIPSLRVALITKMTDEKKRKLRLKELEALTGKHLKNQQQIEFYQARISAVDNKKVKV